MLKLIVVPDGWKCTLEECPPGFFVRTHSEGVNTLCFKTEYREDDGKIQAFNEAGEWFACGASSEEERRLLIVQPVIAKWEDV